MAIANIHKTHTPAKATIIFRTSGRTAFPSGVGLPYTDFLPFITILHAFI